MTCRDGRTWRALLEHRFVEAAEPAEWSEALAHLDGCGSCRRIALAIDPSLVFQRLAEPVAAAVSAASVSEIEAMRAAVAGLRRASALGMSSPSSRSSNQEARPRRTLPRRLTADVLVKLGRLAAAAALLIALGAQIPVARRGGEVSPAAGLAAMQVAGSALTPDLAGGAGGGSLGVSGDVGRPQARVYEIAYRDMAVVMVVDKSLDL